MNAVHQTLNRANLESTQAAEGQKAEQALHSGATFLPKSDIVERENEYHLFLEIPGVKKENVELQLEQNTLKITGKLQSAKRGQTLHTEYREGNYERSFTLSEGVDQTEITAHLEDGLLEVTIPKKPEAAPIQITVQ